MALSYANLDKLTATDAFLGRVRNALRHYADYLFNGTPTQPQTAWYSKIFYQPGTCAQVAANLAGELVQDGAFSVATDSGFASDPSLATEVTDASLQTAVEKICLNY